ncbi:MAG: ubiquitin-like protein Pup [Ornithinimicrobium sp.]
MAGREQRHHTSRDEPDPEPPDDPPASTSGSASAKDEETDALLDEIDNVLESNAQDFVHSFVQKGGQ